MKTKEILLVTTLALMLPGCGSNEDKSDDIQSPDKEEDSSLLKEAIKKQEAKKKVPV